MDIELKLMLAITRRFPKIRGFGRLGNWLKSFYNRKPRDRIITDAHGFTLSLEPAECVDGELVFFPQLYDYHEFAYLRTKIQQGDTFVDAGANIGIYSLIVSELVGDAGLVLAIEADPYNAAKLNNNLQLNEIRNVHLVRVGLSDCNEHLQLMENLSGNRGGNTFSYVGDSNGPVVSCSPLLDILKTQNVKKLAGLKIDIEGFEQKVLMKFFSDAQQDLYPEFIIIEMNPAFAQAASLHHLLLGSGYERVKELKLNSIYQLRNS